MEWEKTINTPVFGKGFNQKPTVFGQQQTAFNQKPTVFGQQQTAFNQKPTVFGQQQTAFNQKPTVFGQTSNDVKKNIFSNDSFGTRTSAFTTNSQIQQPSPFVSNSQIQQPSPFTNNGQYNKPDIFSTQQYGDNTKEVINSLDQYQPINNLFVQYNPINNFYYEPPTQEKDQSYAGLTTPHGSLPGITYPNRSKTSTTSYIPKDVSINRNRSFPVRSKHPLSQETNTRNINNFLIPPIDHKKLTIRPRT